MASLVFGKTIRAQALAGLKAFEEGKIINIAGAIKEVLYLFSAFSPETCPAYGGTCVQCCRLASRKHHHKPGFEESLKQKW